MTTLREQGRVNENTMLIDTMMEGIAGANAVYLVEAGKKCLIDTGPHAVAPRIIRTLKELNAFPPDYVVLTHSHYDHCQGIPLIRKMAKKEGKTITVLASEKSIPLLKDQSWNRVFDPKERFKAINDVSPLKENETIDLDGLSLRVINTPGHTIDQIALLDEKNSNIFVGCALGNKWGDQLFAPPFMPPFWIRDGFYTSIDKLRQTPFESLSLNHFGCVYGEEEGRKLMDEAVSNYEKWWAIFERVQEAEKLDNIKALAPLVKEELNIAIPDFKLQKTSLKLLLGFINALRKPIRKPPLRVGDILFPRILEMLVNGYKISKGIEVHGYRIEDSPVKS
jgi:glyoxylase-like metal-dependent hydrolase (beta-lactamase superfamily II)